jgi:hypothetical protein
MSLELVQSSLIEHAKSGKEGLCITILHKGKIVGVDMDPSATQALLKIDFDAPEGEGIPAHNFIQQYLMPAVCHLKNELEEL